MPAVSSRTSGTDIFDTARTIAVAALIAAATAAIVGSFLDWVTITERPELARDANFGGQTVEEPEFSEPYSGIEARDGWIVVGAGAVLFVGGLGLAIRKTKAYALIAFLAAMVIGGIAFADFRSIGDVSSAISDRMDIIGDPEPAIGITVVAVAGVIGLAGAVTGLVATPSNR